MVNLADLPSAGALSGSETLPMQQGSGAVKVTANQLLSRGSGGSFPFEIGGQRIATLNANGLGIGVTAPERGIHVRGGTTAAATIRAQGVGAGVEPSFDMHSPSGHVFSLGGISGGGMTFTQVGVGQRAAFRSNGDFTFGPTPINVNTGNNTIAGCGFAPYGTAHLARESTGPKLMIQTLGQTALSTGVQFYYGSTPVGSITNSISATAYNTTSDYRLEWKAGHMPLSGSGDFIDALNPRFFPVVGHAGFIAHEFAVASPSSVTGEKDAVDDDGNPVYQQMDASSPDVMANIVAELQDLRRRVAALEAAT